MKNKYSILVLSIILFEILFLFYLNISSMGGVASMPEDENDMNEIYFSQGFKFGCLEMILTLENITDYYSKEYLTNSTFRCEEDNGGWNIGK